VERVPRAKQLLCANTKAIYLAGVSPSLISPKTKQIPQGISFSRFAPETSLSERIQESRSLGKAS